MSATNAIEFTFTPKMAKKAAIRCMSVGLVPFQRSSPGIGKSSIAREIAEEHELEYIDVRLSQLMPEDMIGLPHKNSDTQLAEFLPFGFFPTKKRFPKGNTKINPKTGRPYRGWLVHLDEFNSGSKAVQAASYKFVLDRYVGMEELPDSCAIICSGNLDSDKAITQPLSTAMQSRLVHIVIEVSHDDFRDWAHKNGLDYRIMGFLEMVPGNLHDFRPDHTDKTFACPRTWEFTSRLIKGVDKLTEEFDLPLLAGAISGGMAVDFINFCKEYDNIPKLDEILKNPKTAKVPSDNGTRFATLSFLMDHMTGNQIRPILEYVDNYWEEEQMMFLRSVFRRNPRLRDERDASKALAKVVRFLHDD